MECVATLGPLVEMEQGLEEGDGAEDEAEELDQAPVPAQGLV